MKIILIGVLLVLAILSGYLIIKRTNEGKLVRWFDCLNGSDEMMWEGSREYTHEAFDGITFHCTAHKLEAISNNGNMVLYDGTPILSVYFQDLNGDGKPELCSTVSVGSGIVDNRIIVYDYLNKKQYELSDRGYNDFTLNVKDDSLIVEKKKYSTDEIVGTGKLVLKNGELNMESN